MDSLLRDLHGNGVFQFGGHKLKSGKISQIYIDFRGLISSPNSLKTAIGALWDKATSASLKPTSLCGVPYAALPLAVGLSLENDIPMLLRRKEAKEHGTGKQIEGVYETGQNVVIVEDVVTSGSSVIETAQLLRSLDLTVTDALVLLDRQQGGRQALQEQHIRLHCVLTMEDVWSFLVREKIKSEAEVEEIKKSLTSDPEAGGMGDGSPAPGLDWGHRMEQQMHPKARKLFSVIEQKRSKLCVAADFKRSADILQLAEAIGNEICLLKLHADIIDDFSDSFISQLRGVAEKKNFLLFEDRKFADTGATTALQLAGGTTRISSWADFITVHAVAGQSALDGLQTECQTRDIGVFLVAELSSNPDWRSPKDAQNAVEFAVKNRSLVAGFICQKRCSADPGFLYLTPGVNLKEWKDQLGQRFRTPEEALFRDRNDIIIVGRGITGEEDRAAAARTYREVSWQREVSCLIGSVLHFE